MTELEKHFDEGLRVLKKRNKKFRFLVKQTGTIKFKKRELNFEGLIEVIVNQQLSKTIANKIFSRIKDLFPSSDSISPKELHSVTPQKLKRTGLSYSKVGFIKSLCKALIKNPHLMNEWQELTNEQAFIEIQKMKGLGPWSANIILLFYMGRKDIFPIGDAVLEKAYFKIYGVKLNSYIKAHIQALAWSLPFKSILSLYLWKWVDEGMKE